MAFERLVLLARWTAGGFGRLRTRLHAAPSSFRPAPFRETFAGLISASPIMT